MSRNRGIQIRRVVVFGFFLALMATIALAQSWNCRLVENIGYWSWGSADRFKYDYAARQWWDNTSFGAWQKLGTVGASAPVYDSITASDPNFIGNGGWHDMGSGLSYRYFSSGDFSNWLVNGNMRFAYTYGTGLWADYYWKTDTWSLLGSSGVSSAFLGDGGWHNVGTGLSYRYASGGDFSNWLVNGNMRFAYTYGTGLWADYYWRTDTWSLLGSSGLSSAFLGDGAWHTVGTDLSYKYFAGDYSNWLVNGKLRFAYTYGSGLWADYSSGVNTWSLLGSSGLSSAFIGDGNWHNLNAGWSYSFIASSSEGFWREEHTDPVQFKYNYMAAQWWDYLPSLPEFERWGRLGPSGISQAFIGDGAEHEFGNSTIHFRFNSGDRHYYWAIKNGDVYVDYYKYNFDGKRWSYFFPDRWQSLADNATETQHNVRYLGTGSVIYTEGTDDPDFAARHLFVESYLHPDVGILTMDSSLIDLYEQQIRPRLKDITYDCYAIYAEQDPWDGKQPIISWAINRPGADNVWSGGDLNVAFCNTFRDSRNDQTDFNQGYAEYTFDDTIVFKTNVFHYSFDDSASNPSHHQGLRALVDSLGIVRQYFGKQISNVVLSSHGYTGGCTIGESVSGYKDSASYYQNSGRPEQFIRWGAYMAEGAQILFNECLVAATYPDGTPLGAPMLDAIAVWTNSAIFAHDIEAGNLTWYVNHTDEVGLVGTVEATGAPNYHWNNNIQYQQVHHDGSSDRFQYSSNPTVTPHVLFREEWEY